MGKENIARSPCNSSKENTRNQQQSIVLELMETTSTLWNFHKILSTKTIREDGRIFVTVINSNKEYTVVLKGFSVRNNETNKIFKTLVKMRIVMLDTKLLNFLKFRNNMWCKEKIESHFDSGDRFMLVIEPKKAQTIISNLPAGLVRKPIKKLRAVIIH